MRRFFLATSLCLSLLGVIKMPTPALAATCVAVVDELSSGKLQGACVLENFCKDEGGSPAPDKGDCTGSFVCCGFPKAAAPSPTAQPTSFALTNPIGAGSTLFTVIRNVITFFVGMVGALALGVFVYAGVTWMTAGSSDRIQKAKDAMKYAVIGLALIAFAFAITTFFIDTLTGKVQQQSLKDQAAQQKAAATPPPVNP